ncbi:hypothetical protein APY94_04135 [Thermococcus celericrescens]|uniref:DNA methylase n=1 Tax=Thermococcus celericrescens TaxID=227598 RepID=A0A117IU38_9EURY|nr:hypothetical protein [Thermococcus celericrescens]KUH33927.1 hypothetical protein APY94_04135 [Thermococcus celericrescens]
MVAALYRLHPQQTSLRDALRAAELAGLDGQVVLDPFAGTGTLVYAAARAGARFVVGSDIEDWSEYLRPQLSEVQNFALYWRVDAMHAVKRFEHDVLFTDPPNPARVDGSAPISLVRDFGISGSQLKSMFSFNERNLMGREWVTVTYVVRLIRYELEQGRRVVVHAFRDSGRDFDWKKILRRHFHVRTIYDDYVEVV